MRNRESKTRGTGHTSVPSGMKSGKSAGASWGNCKGQGELWSRPQLSTARTWKKKG